MYLNAARPIEGAECYKKGCSNPSIKRCGFCKLARYCSAECQSSDWIDGKHSSDCKFFVEDLMKFKTIKHVHYRCTDLLGFTPFAARADHVDILDVDDEKASIVAYPDGMTMRKVAEHMWPSTIYLDCCTFVHMCWQLLLDRVGRRKEDSPACLFAMGSMSAWALLGIMTPNPARLNFKCIYLDIDGAAERKLAKHMCNHVSTGQWLLENRHTGILLGLVDDFESAARYGVEIAYAPRDKWIAICKKRVIRNILDYSRILIPDMTPDHPEMDFACDIINGFEWKFTEHPSETEE
jgi:hypothetical protein